MEQRERTGTNDIVTRCGSRVGVIRENKRTGEYRPAFLTVGIGRSEVRTKRTNSNARPKILSVRSRISLISCRLFILAQLAITPRESFQAQVVLRDYSGQYTVQYQTREDKSLLTKPT